MLKAGRRRCGKSKGEVSIIDSPFGDKTGASPAALLPAPESQSHGSINTRSQIECSQGLPRLCLPFFYIRTEATLSTKCNGCVLSHVQLFATPWTVGHLSHAHHVPGTAFLIWTILNSWSLPTTRMKSAKHHTYSTDKETETLGS